MPPEIQCHSGAKPGNRVPPCRTSSPEVIFISHSECPFKRPCHPDTCLGNYLTISIIALIYCKSEFFTIVNSNSLGDSSPDKSGFGMTVCIFLSRSWYQGAGAARSLIPTTFDQKWSCHPELNPERSEGEVRDLPDNSMSSALLVV